MNTESKREELKQIVLSANEQELDRIIKILEAMQGTENGKEQINYEAEGGNNSRSLLTLRRQSHILSTRDDGLI